MYTRNASVTLGSYVLDYRCKNTEDKLISNNAIQEVPCFFCYSKTKTIREGKIPYM